ncbi:hypothetical protein Acsp06_35860 [Actinomycetospora sp. NBRC 106375]|uniref:hypothetical protein n=1 Tax=Actinomycetospora sp. NBRC 106375 TaxID=3032207 RepID=UPI0024A393C8|nr:hypothetical protein [Actinomycetospora sp. NBRC 106375]GLZ47401.1 hypothetical protein Acsp06_35860 [Actinomycetospora sp. NBRC 106375]
MTGQGGGAGDAGRAAQERLTEEARATASALLDWLGTRMDVPTDAAARPPGSDGVTGSRRLGMRPPQSPGPCAWCPVCALVAALRGEQPELTARLAEQASGLMMLLRLMLQTHQDGGHGHGRGPAPEATPGPGSGPPPGWPAEWGAWDGWGASPGSVEDPAVDDEVPAVDDEVPAVDDEDPAVDDEVPAVDDEVPDETVPDETGDGVPSGTPAAPGDVRDVGSAADARARRRVPIRRASPRSAAFRDPEGAGRSAAEATPGTSTAGRDAARRAAPTDARPEQDATPDDGAPVGAPRPGPRASGAGPRPAPRRASARPAATPRPAATAAATPAPTPTSAAAAGSPGTPPPATRSTTAPETARSAASGTARPGRDGTPTAPARPSVQRIAIRRPPRRSGAAPGDTSDTEPLC